MATVKNDDAYVMDLLTPGEKEIIKRVKEAEKFTQYGWQRHGAGWEDYIPRHEESRRAWINAFTRYFLGGFGFQKHQLSMHYSPIPDIQIMGGVGSGKTTPAAISAACRASLNPAYDVLWAAPILSQAKLAYNLILEWGAGNRWGEVFMYDWHSHPYPVIKLRPWDKYDPGSSLEFRSLGQDPAEMLRGGEYSEAVADEAMRPYPTTWYIALISGRLRGPNRYMLNAHPELRSEYAARVEEIEWTDDPEERKWLRKLLEAWIDEVGLAKRTRITVIGNAPRGAEWWRRWERGIAHPEERFSARWSTRKNLYVTQKQLDLQRRQYRGREDEMRVELDAMKPPAGGDVFPYLETFFSAGLLSEAIEKITEDEPGWVVQTVEELGLYWYEKPVDPSGAYVFALDPGSGILGKRNQWVLLGARIDRNPNSDPPSPFEIVYMKAGNLPGGHGSPNPWIAAARDVVTRYPIPFGMFGVESSGVQKNTHQVVWPDDLKLVPIFLNNVMMTLIIEAQRTIGSDMWTAPDCSMFSDEMAEFQYKMDKTDPQDWVCSFLILNHLAYPLVHERFEVPEDESVEEDYWEVGEYDREIRDTEREVRSAR